MEELRRIQKYLGLEYSDERLNQILERCSSKNLKADVEQKRVNTPFLTREGTSYVYRKGDSIYRFCISKRDIEQNHAVEHEIEHVLS